MGDAPQSSELGVVQTSRHTTTCVLLETRDVLRPCTIEDMVQQHFAQATGPEVQDMLEGWAPEDERKSLCRGS